MDLDIESHILWHMEKEEIKDLILYLDNQICSREWTKDLVQKLVETL